MRIAKKSPSITSLREWGRFAGPKKESQWRDGRSAKETAKAWLSTGVPAIPGDIREALDSCEHTCDLSVEVAHPEHPIPFDNYAGEPRNADLAFIGKSKGQKIAVTIEAKADETFGDQLEKELREAHETKLKKPRSNKLKRINDLTAAILGVEGELTEELLQMRYQLLTATAGTLAYAKENSADIALLLIHVFETSKTKERKLLSNEADFTSFANYLSSQNPEANKCGQLSGPFHFEESEYISKSIPLYLCKVVTKTV